MKALDPQPQEVKENLEELLRDLDEKVPPKQLDRNLLIATWNIRGFGDLTRSWMSKEGDSPRRDLHSVHCIAEILRRFDVIAIQEVKSNIRALRDTLKILGDEWSMILTDVNQGSAGNGERMAYLFDTRRVNLSGLAGELVVPDEWRSGASKNVMQEQFVRSPYAVSF
ncbi:endonuclease/exonuclease/phosphatase family protein [Porphyromonas endodontalis]|nr:endonuclease/exonuclease/phosphatase family protein [Porphyromonas endodontalis]